MSLLLCTEWLSHPQNSNSSIWWWKITRPAEDGTQRPAHDSTRLCCHHVTFPPEPRRSLRTYGAQRVVITEAWSLSLIAMTWYRSGFICLDIDLAAPKETWPASWNLSFIRQCTLDCHVLGTTQDSSDPQKCALLWQTTKYIGTISANWLVSQMFQDHTWYISCCLGWMMKSREGFEVINSHV